jgi:hypothetical protein
LQVREWNFVLRTAYGTLLTNFQIKKTFLTFLTTNVRFLQERFEKQLNAVADFVDYKPRIFTQIHCEDRKSMAQISPW